MIGPGPPFPTLHQSPSCGPGASGCGVKGARLRPLPGPGQLTPMSTRTPSPGARAVSVISDPTAALLLLHPFAGEGWWAGALIIAIQAVLLLALVAAYRRRGGSSARSTSGCGSSGSSARSPPTSSTRRRPGSTPSWSAGSPGSSGPSAWTGPRSGCSPSPDSGGDQLSRDLVFCASEIRQGRVVGVASLDQLPGDAAVDRRALQGRRRAVAPGGAAVGQRAHPRAFSRSSCSIGSARGPRRWCKGSSSSGRYSPALIARRDAEAAIRSSDAMSTAVLSSLAARVAVLDRWGKIIQVNPAWLESGRGAAPDRRQLPHRPARGSRTDRGGDVPGRGADAVGSGTRGPEARVLSGRTGWRPLA